MPSPRTHIRRTGRPGAGHGTGRDPRAHDGLPHPTGIDSRTLLGGLLGLGTIGALTACSGSTPAASTSTATATGTTSATASAAGDAYPTLASLATVKSRFTQATYTDPTTGKALPYNVFLPAGYSAATKYPLLVYIADASLVGKATTAPLSQYGALVWAADADQAKHLSIVVVPEFPEVILDDHSGHTTTEYVELTGRFVTWLKSKYSVDTRRVYGTGQSMGCITCLYLAGKYPDMFTAELFVSGQWDTSVLPQLPKARFTYLAAVGDTKSTGGQADVEKLLTSPTRRPRGTRRGRPPGSRTPPAPCTRPAIGPTLPRSRPGLTLGAVVHPILDR